MRRGVDPLVLGLLRGLPEEAIGRDRRAQHRDHGDDVVFAQREIRHEGAIEDQPPGHVHHERDGHIGEQHEAGPFQDGDIALVAGEHLEQHAADREADGIEADRAADQQLQRRGHRAEIGAEIDDIRHEQQPDDRAQQPGRVMRADVAGNALAGHPAHARADLLDRRHQREAEQHHPAQRVAELRARLRVGGDPARIVVGGAGDQSRAEPAEQPLVRRAAGGAAPGDAGRQHGERFSVGF